MSMRPAAAILPTNPSAGGDAECAGLTQLVFEDVTRPHVRASLGEGDGDRTTESVRGAGDDRDAAGEVEVHWRLGYSATRLLGYSAGCPLAGAWPVGRSADSPQGPVSSERVSSTATSHSASMSSSER